MDDLPWFYRSVVLMMGFTLISATTGVSTSTLSKWANTTIQDYNRNILGRLCVFLNAIFPTCLCMNGTKSPQVNKANEFASLESK